MLEVAVAHAFGRFALDVAFTGPAEGVTLLFGPSGAGKSSTLAAIAGAVRPAAGRIAIEGRVLTAPDRFVPPHRRRIGFVHQEARLFPHLGVRGNLRYGLARAQGRGRIGFDEVVEVLGIAPLLDRRTASLSGGERQRVALGGALLSQPDLLLMDEPLAALDLKRKAEILPYLERLHDELDIPILYVSHSPDEVARLADHLVLLDQGRAVASGPVVETLARTDLPISHLEDAGVVIDGRVLEHNADYGLLTLALPHCEQRIRLAHAPMDKGRALRIKVQARDVSLSLEPAAHSSILNVLPATVLEIVSTDNPAHLLVKLEVAGTPLLARITRYSHDQLGLHTGQAVWAQIKSVALLA